MTTQPDNTYAPKPWEGESTVSEAKYGGYIIRGLYGDEEHSRLGVRDREDGSVDILLDASGEGTVVKRSDLLEALGVPTARTEDLIAEHRGVIAVFGDMSPIGNLARRTIQFLIDLETPQNTERRDGLTPYHEAVDEVAHAEKPSIRDPLPWFNYATGARRSDNLDGDPSLQFEPRKLFSQDREDYE